MKGSSRLRRRHPSRHSYKPNIACTDALSLQHVPVEYTIMLGNTNTNSTVPMHASETRL